MIRPRFQDIGACLKSVEGFWVGGAKVRIEGGIEGIDEAGDQNKAEDGDIDRVFYSNSEVCLADAVVIASLAKNREGITVIMSWCADGHIMSQVSHGNERETYQLSETMEWAEN